MDYSIVFAVTMLALGLALIVAELFIPSGGVISLLSVICIGVSIFTVHGAWWAEYPNRFWWFVGSILGLIPATAGGALFLLSRTRLGSRVLLEAPKLEDVTPYSHEAEERKQLIGKHGKALTLMAPGGLVVVEGKRWHAETEGQMLDPEQPVEIIAVKGNRVVVRPYDPRPSEKAGSLSQGPIPEEDIPAEEKPKTQPKSKDDLAQTAGESAAAPLDFEIPES
jgi:membrane-bound ClpP family serine protease